MRIEYKKALSLLNSGTALYLFLIILVGDDYAGFNIKEMRFGSIDTE